MESSNALLCMVGDGSLKDELISYAEELGIAEKCVFPGAQPHDRIPLWLAAADCLVLCSLNEGLPTILAEAMLCGTPVIATPVGGVPEIVQHGNTGLLVPVGDSNALAQAMQKILTDPHLAALLSNQAREFARKALTWEANAKKVIAVYEEAMTSRAWPVADPHISRRAA
jgi:glycosyltransferase involved in cell wall biosynthesis